MASAERELLADTEEAWRFLAEPHHLADWWPGIVGVEPDRRGLTPGARWRVSRRGPRGLLRLPDGGLNGPARTGILLVGEVVPGRRLDWRLLAAEGAGRLFPPLEVSIELERRGSARSLVRITVRSRRVGSGDRREARAAVDRLYALVQTAAAP